MFEDLIRGWEGEEVLAHYDAPTDTWMFICIHSTRLGPAAGGCRMKTYGSPAEALEDCMRLAGGMTLKTAAGGLPMGGAKSVIAVPEVPPPGSEHRARIVRRFATMLSSLKGTYWTGPDMNTSQSDMDVIYEVAPYTFGRSPRLGGSGDSAPDTAEGVLHGIRASVEHVFTSADLGGRTVAIQGLGGVGGRLAELLAKEGARLRIADVDPDRAANLAELTGAEVVAPDEIVTADCDVYAPCAVGGTINVRTIPSLRCRIVAGGANNQLVEPIEDAERLRDAGILYAPDYVINAGGAYHLIGQEALGWTRQELERSLAGIGETLSRIYRRADEQGISTELAAERIAEERLAAG